MKRKPCIEEKKMKQLWTPWRIEYILGPKPDSCVFCLPESRDEDEERLVLYRGRHAFVIMNKFPYSNGHIMVCPYRHVMALAQLETDETHEIMDLMQRCTLVDMLNVVQTTIGILLTGIFGFILGNKIRNQ